MNTLTWIALASASGVPVVAAAKPAAEQQIAQVIAACVQSWDAADPVGIANAYEHNGDFVSPDGLHATGQTAIAAFYRRAFANGYAHSHGEFAIRNIRFAGPGLAIIDGVWKITDAHGSKGGIREPERGLAVAILRRHSNTWKIVALREQARATELHEI